MRRDSPQRRPANASARDGLVVQAIQAFQQGAHDKACRLFQDASRTGAVRDPRFEFNFGFVHRQAGKVDQALLAFERALRMKPDFTDALFQKGLCFRDLGRGDDAAAAYQAVLRIDASHFGARLNLANHWVAMGELDAAGEAYRELFDRSPNDANVMLGLGNVHYAREQWTQALVWYERAVAMGNKTLDALCNLGAALAKLDRHDEAIERYRHALDLQRDHSGALLGLSDALTKTDRSAEASAVLSQAIDRGVEQLAIWRRCATLLDQAGQSELALALLDRALVVHPGDPDLLGLKAVCLNSLERYEETIVLCDELVASERTATIVAWNAKGTALDRLDRIDESVECFKRALQIDPNHPDLLNNLGNAYREQQRWDEAIDLITRAIERRPDYADAFYNRAIARGDLLQIDASLDDYERCLAIAPAKADAHFNRALTLLLDGQFEPGWEAYEWRWKTHHLKATKHPDWIPMWDGSASLEGRTILVYAEQGLGDTIQFVRLVRQLVRRRAKVLLQVQAPLLSVLERLEPSVIILPESVDVEADYRCPMMSLPLALRLRLRDLVQQGAYLSASPERVATWRERLGAPKGSMRVGVVWSGSVGHTNDRNRSLPFELFESALPIGPEYVCLQREIRDIDRAALADRPDVRLLEAQLADFGDTAAVCELMDLVISVDTSVAHLAGALGRPIWILLHRAPDMRWLLDRSDSPWYESARLFRQTDWGDWAGVLARVAHELGSLADWASMDIDEGIRPSQRLESRR